MFSQLVYIGVSLIVITIAVDAEYITYIKTDNNKYEPIMEPVSSTIESVPMYKLSKKLSYNFDDLEEYEKNELLTASNIQQHRERKSKTLDNKERHYVKVEPMN